MQTTRDLAFYRFEQARQNLSSAEILEQAADYKGATNRSYYAVFHGIRAVLALENLDFKSHSAVISHFRKNYIKAGTFPVEMSHIVGALFQVRNDSDYQDFFLISKEEVVEQLASAKFFLDEVEKFLQQSCS